MSELNRINRVAQDAIPALPPDIIEWAEENVIFPSSARSKHFKVSISPWIKEPMQRCVDLPTRIVTLMKPVQSAGSVCGEVVMLYWIKFWAGFLQFNWSNDKRADERWESRIKGIMESSPPIMQLMDNCDVSIGEIDFGNVFFRQQGNLDSDSVRLQINEEVHAWEPGHLKKARNRTTAVWNSKSFDISNAGEKNDQLHSAFKDGTAQHWEVKCPGCGQFHRMRTRWEDSRPDLGGLRYDAEGARRGHFDYDYNKIRPTIRFQMPCGFTVHNQDITLRKSLSDSGRYGEPTNTGAELSHRSYTYEGVIVDYIDWMLLIKDKHDALKARSLGDPEPWRRYICERECIPFDPNDVPLLNIITTSKGIKKNREGLAGEKLRLFALDRQRGTEAKGELSYWWALIRDVQFNTETGKLRSRLIYEGRLETDEQVILILDEHNCNRWQGVADSGYDTSHVYNFCYKNGINAIKGGKEDIYVHPQGMRRIFSQERPLHRDLNRPSLYPYLQVSDGRGGTESLPDPREPMYWLYSKVGIRERLHWMRTETEYETPEDVSEDYKLHQEAEERMETKNPSDNTTKTIYYQHKDRNDQYVNECYIAMQVDQAGMIFLQLDKQNKK